WCRPAASASRTSPATCGPGRGPWASARRCWATRAPAATWRRWPPAPRGWSRSSGERTPMGELVTLGEVMAVTRVSGIGIPSPGAPATLSYAGAEATVAIGMSRLGHRATWLGRLGRDAAADMILTSMRGEGVDVSHTVRDDDRPTGQMTRYRRTADRVVVVYHRRDGAGVRLSPGDVGAEALAAADVLHLTGITPALGPGPAAAVERALEVAEQAGVPVSFDVNYRASLWPPEQAGEVLRRLAGRAEVVFAGLEEARLVVNGAPAARADG